MGVFLAYRVTAMAVLGAICLLLNRSMSFVHHVSTRTSSYRQQTETTHSFDDGTYTDDISKNIQTTRANVEGVVSQVHGPTSTISSKSRRDALSQTALTSSGVILSFVSGGLSAAPSPAWGASSSSSKNKSKEELAQLEVDKQKILAGYKRLNYLLDNWKQETTVCGKRGNNDRFDDGCDRTPEKVMDYLGYKSMNDPLFKAEKRLFRLQSLVSDTDIDGQMKYQDALEKFSEKADEGTGMAFVSSWGEANPGGGKDRVELFIERSKNDVIEVRDSLKTMIEILGLEQTS